MQRKDCGYEKRSSDFGDEFYFDKDVSRQPSNFDGGSCGRCNVLGEVFAVHLVHGGEVIQALEKHRCLDDAVKTAAGGFKHSLQIFKHAGCLFCDAAFNDLLRCWVERNLTGGENEIACAHGLGIWADSSRCSLSGDNRFSHESDCKGKSSGWRGGES